MKTQKPKDNKAVLITGGAGFIGTNVATRLIEEGNQVIIYDNFSREGVERNFHWLKERYGAAVRMVEADVLDEERLSAAVSASTRIFHFAAQVAVTTSLDDPMSDFATNAKGTLNLLEAVRKTGRTIPILYTSTNKVYGDLSDLQLSAAFTRYHPASDQVAAKGIDENRHIDFHSPYGCSKGAAEQYVLDYSRTFGLQTVVFRMSCIYGPHQFGTEDQGWVAHFLLRAMRNQAITLYGDGKQVRDILYVGDLVKAMLLAHEKIAQLSGQAFNIGGGPANSISLLELTDLIGRIRGKAVEVRFAEWRMADQKYYVSDTSRFMAATGWKPGYSIQAGVEQLHDWLCKSGTSAPVVKSTAGSPLQTFR